MAAKRNRGKSTPSGASVSTLPAIDEAHLDHIPRCLVAMPFTKPWSRAFSRAVHDVMHSLQVDVFTVDTTKRTALKLAKDVENQVATTDILVAEVTDQNPNVHIEIGLAISHNKDLLICTQSPNHVCAHINDYLFIQYTPDKIGLQELSRQLRLRIQECLDRAAHEREHRRLLKQLNPEYTVTCYKDRNVANLGDLFTRARRRIDILTTNLSWLFFPPSGSPSTYWDRITQAVTHNASLQLRIVTLNPESEIAAARGRQLGFAPATFREQLRKALHTTRAFASKYPTNRVEVRLYEELPTQITFRIDDVVLTCIVGQPMQSRNYPVLRFDVADPGVQEAFLAHFLNVWKTAE